MRSLREIRGGKPSSYPDQAVYAEFAGSRFGLDFTAIDGGSGLAFSISSNDRRVWFGGGRCSYFPQNTAAAATLAADKYLSAIVLEQAGVPTLGGSYFFLHDRHRAHRPAGHERADAIGYLRDLGGKAFVKPLTGSRGDFAQAIDDEAALQSYLDNVMRHYDSIIMQPIVTGDEVRIVVLDDAMLYCARKQPPCLVGDGVSTMRELAAHNDVALMMRGLSEATATDNPDSVPKLGERRPLPGRINRSAGGDMSFAPPPAGAEALAIKAVRTLGLRVGGVDIFAGINDAPTMRVIEINANPAIRFLEDSGRDELILEIWRHTFAATGLLEIDADV